MATDTAARTEPDVCRAILEAKSDEEIVLSLPGTSYRLHLKPTVPAASIATEIGKRIRGVVRGKAQRMHAAAAGGRFIEPVYGHPRIVQGTVLATDAAANRVLIEMVIPAWLEVADGQKASEFAPGTLVNMYVESGMTFTPLA
jgi:hypothetical protein